MQQDAKGNQQMENSNRQIQINALGALVLAVLPALFLLGENCTKDSISPYDPSLYVANGVFIAELIHDLPNVLVDPKDWLWQYYEQYPALAVRRHPPAFAFLEGFVFSISGNSVRVAHTIVFAYAILFSLMVYATCQCAGINRFIAALCPWLLFSSFEVADIGQGVWLDLPMLAAFFTACYFFTRACLSHNPSPTRSSKDLRLFALFLVLSIYTYQLAGPLLVGILLFWIFLDGPRQFLNRERLTIALASAFFLIPFLMQNLILASDDQLRAVLSGSNPQKWASFEGAKNGGSSNWVMYLKMLFSDFPIAALAILIAFPLVCLKRLNKFESCMITMALICYLFYGRVASIGPRYCISIAVPLVLVFVSLVDRFCKSRNLFTNKQINTCTIVIALTLLGWVNYLWTNKEGMHTTRDFLDLASEIATTQNAIKIVYCGEWDAGFVLAIAMADEQRKIQVLKAGRHLKKETDVQKYLSHQKPDIIFYEQAPAQVDSIDRPAVRVALEQFERENSTKITSKDVTINLTNNHDGVITRKLRELRVSW